MSTCACLYPISPEVKQQETDFFPVAAFGLTGRCLIRWHMRMAARLPPITMNNLNP
jgi:hypothetical protein